MRVSIASGRKLAGYYFTSTFDGLTEEGARAATLGRGIKHKFMHLWNQTSP
jgi:hypothetical protein